MSRKEVPRAGLLKMVLAGQATNAQGAAALRVSPRHVQRLKVRFQAEGAPGLLHRGRGRPSTTPGPLPAPPAFTMPSNPIDRARGFMGKGWAPIPVPHREKAPIIQGWQTLRIGTDDLPHYFNSEPLNVSVLLGDASAGLVDIDLDAAETLPLAALVLPATAAKFGRASKPASHWLYTASPLARTEKFQEPREPGGDNEKTVMLVELRVDVDGVAYWCPEILSMADAARMACAGQLKKVAGLELRWREVVSQFE